jgi:hypothetical protein
MLVAFQNKEFRKIFAPEMEQVAGRLEKLHNEAIPDVCALLLLLLLVVLLLLLLLLLLAL